MGGNVLGISMRHEAAYMCLVCIPSSQSGVGSGIIDLLFDDVDVVSDVG